MAQRSVKAKYRVVGPKMTKVLERQSRMVAEKGSEVPSKQDDFVEVEHETFMVFFPQGHSIRINRAELVRMGYHLKPRLIDMETGDVVDIGGDPYDFMMAGEGEPEEHPTLDFHLEDDDKEQEQAELKPAKAAKGI